MHFNAAGNSRLRHIHTLTQARAARTYTNFVDTPDQHHRVKNTSARNGSSIEQTIATEKK